MVNGRKESPCWRLHKRRENFIRNETVGNSRAGTFMRQRRPHNSVEDGDDNQRAVEYCQKVMNLRPGDGRNEGSRGEF